MEEIKKARFKIFLWDQFILPVYLLLNIHQLQALLLALLILNFIIWKNILFFWFLVITLGIIFIYQTIKYYKSGEFVYNYRKYKSEKGEYKDYRKLTKILKKEKSNGISYPFKDKSIGLHDGVHRPNYEEDKISEEEGLTNEEINNREHGEIGNN